MHLPALFSRLSLCGHIGLAGAWLASLPAGAAAPTAPTVPTAPEITLKEITELSETLQRQRAAEQAVQAALTSWNATAAQRVQTYKDGPGRKRWQDAAQQVARVRSNPPSPAAGQLWQALDAGVDAASGRNPLARATDPRSGDELAWSSAWLRHQVLQQHADGRYSYAYALNLSRLGRPGEYLMEVAIFLAHARLALQIDADRCADTTLAMDVMAGYESQAHLRELDRAVKALPPRQRATAVLEAIVIEETLGERPPLPWLCQAPKAPHWVDEAAWQAARRQRLQQATASLLRDL